jgi:hypothetical protein
VSEEKETGEKCKRERCTILGENMYVAYSDNFITVTVPYENRPENLNNRLAIDRYCESFSEGMIVKHNGELFKASRIEEHILLESRIPDNVVFNEVVDIEYVKILVER